MTFTNNTCNREGCGKPIVWRHPRTGEAILHPETNRPRPLNPDGSLHKCMFKGQKDYFKPTPYGSKIYDY
jgi:hypothetical protein